MHTCRHTAALTHGTNETSQCSSLFLSFISVSHAACQSQRTRTDTARAASRGRVTSTAPAVKRNASHKQPSLRGCSSQIAAAHLPYSCAPSPARFTQPPSVSYLRGFSQPRETPPLDSTIVRDPHILLAPPTRVHISEQSLHRHIAPCCHRTRALPTPPPQ